VTGTSGRRTWPNPLAEFRLSEFRAGSRVQAYGTWAGSRRGVLFALESTTNSIFRPPCFWFPSQELGRRPRVAGGLRPLGGPAAVFRPRDAKKGWEAGLPRGKARWFRLPFPLSG